MISPTLEICGEGKNRPWQLGWRATRITSDRARVRSLGIESLPAHLLDAEVALDRAPEGPG
jgi:hypothetical protein